MIKLLETEDEFFQVQEIFYESSSKKTFSSINERADFQYKYLDLYKIKYPGIFFVYKEKDRVLGYICGAIDCNKDLELNELNPHFEKFKNCFNDYPAELHINCHVDSRGMGIGSQLIAYFENKLKEINICGVHLITAPEAKNVNFYRKNQYSFETNRDINGANLLLLGKSLTSN